MQTQPTPHAQMVYPNWEQAVTFDDDGPKPRPLIESDRPKAVMVGLKAGQSVPHHPSTEAVYHFVHGEGTMSIDEETFTFQAGATIVVPDGASRGITASSDVVFLGTRPAETGHGEHTNNGH